MGMGLAIVARLTPGSFIFDYEILYYYLSQ